MLNGQGKNLSVDFGCLHNLKDGNLVKVYIFCFVKMDDEEITVDFQGLPC